MKLLRPEQVIRIASLCLAISCSKSSENPQKIESSRTTPLQEILPDVPVNPIAGGVQGRVSASLGGVVTASNAAGASEAFKKTVLAVPPGALSIDVDLAISEAVSFASPDLAKNLGITEMKAAGAAVTIDAQAVLTRSLMLTLQLDPSMSLVNNQTELVVIGISKGASRKQLKIYHGDSIKLIGNAVQVNIDQFGTYQASKVDQVPAVTVVQTNITIEKKVDVEAKQAFSRGNSFYVASTTELPTCDAGRVGQLFYIATQAQFRTCLDSSWQIVDIKGPKGDTGAQGAKGDPGVTPDPSIPYIAEIVSNKTVFADGHPRQQILTRFTPAGSGGAARDCITESWTEPDTRVDTGVVAVSYYKSYGDKGCEMTTRVDYQCWWGNEYVGGKCQQACNWANPSLCTTELQCTSRQMGWKNNSCLGSCSDSNLAACTSQTSCEANGLTWNLASTSCQAGCTGYNPAECKTQVQCQRRGYEWDSMNQSCLPRCDPWHPSACNSASKCQQQGMTWKDNACIGSCGSDVNNYQSLVACDSLQKCQSVYQSGRSNAQSSGSQNPSWYTDGFYWSRPGSWDGSQCLATCPRGQIVTSRGCESVTVLPCGSQEELVDNTCVTLATNKIEGNICGTYDGPMLISSGVHQVYCDTLFKSRVLMEPGTTLEAFGSVALTFAETLLAQGTTAAPITFQKSSLTSAPSSSNWKELKIANSLMGLGAILPRLLLPPTYRAGTGLNYVTIKDVMTSWYSFKISGLISNSNITAHHISVLAGDYTAFDTSVLNMAEISGPNTDTIYYYSYNTHAAPWTVFYRSQLRSNSNCSVFGGSSNSPSLSISSQFYAGNYSSECYAAYSSSSNILAFNEFVFYPDLTDLSSSTVKNLRVNPDQFFVFGNKTDASPVSANQSLPSSVVSDNSSSALSIKPLLLVFGASFLRPSDQVQVKAGEDITITTSVITATSISSNYEISWELVDGFTDTAISPIPSGLNGKFPKFQMSTPGMYTLRATGLKLPVDSPDGFITDFMGLKQVSIIVQPN